MARLASNRPLPKPRKLHGPVGPDPIALSVSLGGVDWKGCQDCGYHVCGCKPKEAPKSKRTPITAFSWGYGPDSDVAEQDCGCLLMAYEQLVKHDAWLRDEGYSQYVADYAREKLTRKGWEPMNAHCGMRLPCAEHKQPEPPTFEAFRTYLLTRILPPEDK